MSQYRLYRLDGAGNISSAEWLQADDDESALRAVSAMGLRSAVELWNGKRLVARVEAAPE